MLYRFADCIFDTEQAELRVGGETVDLEPQVFELLRLLIENRHRLVSKDEVIDAVWNGRVISDAAVSSRLKSARQAVGDDGARQQVIRTLPKRGFRFVAEVVTPPAVRASFPCLAATPVVQSSQPSIAILPFVHVGAADEGWLAEALPQELIVELSRLRWLFVIARGSAFRFRGPEVDVAAVGAALGVSYCLTGGIVAEGSRRMVTVELADTRSGGVVWTERFEAPAIAVRELPGQMIQEVVGALALHISESEARRIGSVPPEGLDAWGAYHLGLRGLYHFRRDDNFRAAAYFERAAALEPDFGRAHAGLSFAHFQNSFLRFTPDAAGSAALARAEAVRAMDCDPLDPFCNMVMGRALWLDGDLDASLPWLDRAIQLSPNDAQARYSRALTHALLGKGPESGAEAEAALRLSPLDPLAYGMLGVRALSSLVMGDASSAASWGDAAARAPGAHALIHLIAAVAHHLNGDDLSAQAWVAASRRRDPAVGAGHFFQAFPFRDPGLKAEIAGALRRLRVN